MGKLNFGVSRPDGQVGVNFYVIHWIRNPLYLKLINNKKAFQQSAFHCEEVWGHVGSVLVQLGPSWTSLNISRGLGPSARRGGRPLYRIWDHHPREQADRYDWKHYLPATLPWLLSVEYFLHLGWTTKARDWRSTLAERGLRLRRLRSVTFRMEPGNSQTWNVYCRRRSQLHLSTTLIGIRKPLKPSSTIADLDFFTYHWSVLLIDKGINTKRPVLYWAV